MQLETTDDLDRKHLADTLNTRYSGRDTRDILHGVSRSEFFGSVGMVSSFGTESAVLLHLVSEVDSFLPVIFLDTGKHFVETLDYRNQLIEQLGLNNVQVITPNRNWLEADDPQGMLHESEPDRCCQIRKTRPMMQALRGMRCWITGRKQFQTDHRKDMPLFEVQGRWIKVNPLYDWDRKRIDDYFADHQLPRHPLQSQGYQSIGCHCCTRAVAEGEDVRSGRWAGKEKTECGVHFENGKIVPPSGPSARNKKEHK